MLDIKFVRENPDIVKQNIKNKFQDEKLPLVDEVIELYGRQLKAKQDAEALQASRNALSKQIGALKGLSLIHISSYFTDVCCETRFDPNCELDYQFFHMIGDNIGRFPLDFLRKHCNDFPRSRALLAKIEAESDPNRQRQLFKELGRAVTDLEDADMSALFYDLRIQFEAAVNHTLRCV